MQVIHLGEQSPRPYFPQDLKPTVEHATDRHRSEGMQHEDLLMILSGELILYISSSSPVHGPSQ